MHVKKFDEIKFTNFRPFPIFNNGILSCEKLLNKVLSTFMQILFMSTQSFTDDNSLFIFSATAICVIENKADKILISANNIYLKRFEEFVKYEIEIKKQERP